MLRTHLPKNLITRLARLRSRWFPKYPVLGEEYEPAVAALIVQIVQPGWVCADVGANIGHVTIMLADRVGPKGRVVAFEAHPGNARRLATTVERNGFADTVCIENVAVSDGSADHIDLYPGRGRSSQEWSLSDTDHDGVKHTPALTIPATSLDRYFPSDRQVDFVKIDIEGAEDVALRGMKALLTRQRPIVMVEFHNDAGWQGRFTLYDAGYELFSVEGKRVDRSPATQRVYHCVAFPPGSDHGFAAGVS
ncbi:MAG: FkbM family methyltransferase [Phycisphaera sp.]|nr:FkbM family methyltransferase [Phycisphaera sp.]